MAAQYAALRVCLLRAGAAAVRGLCASARAVGLLAAGG
jgi:hypothetical protein